MKRRRPLASRIADLWVEIGHVGRVAAVLILLVFIAWCSGCASIRPWGDVRTKNEFERTADPRWGPIQEIWIGIKANF